MGRQRASMGNDMVRHWVYKGGKVTYRTWVASLVLVVLAVIVAYSAGDIAMTLARYVAVVVAEGDWLNDWLTHLPRVVQPVVQTIGQLIAGL